MADEAAAPASVEDEDVRLKCPTCGRDLPMSGLGPKAMKYSCVSCGVTFYVRRDSRLLKGTRFFLGA